MRSVEPRLANKGTLPVAILLLIFLSTEIFAQDYPSPIEGSLVQREGAYSIYVIHEGKKYCIPPDMLETLGYSELPVQTLPQGEFDSISEGQDEWLQTRLEEVLTREAPHLQEALREGSLIKKEGDYKVYIVHEGKKYLVTDIKALEERTDPQGRHYGLHEALELSPQDFDAVQKGEDDWFKDFFLKKEPVVRKSPEPKNYPTYTEVFGQYGSNPYKEDYVPSGRYLTEDGQFRRFEEKIFDNVTSNILSPQQLEERRRQREADKLQQRYLEEQIAQQMERYNSNPPYYAPAPGGDYPAQTENPVVNPLPDQPLAEIGTPVAVDATIMQMTEEQLLNMTWEQVFNSMSTPIP